MMPLTRLLELAACPACGGELCLGDDALGCSGCGAAYPLADGLPVLLTPDSAPLARAEAEAHSELAPRYELTHQLESLRNRRAHDAFLAPLELLEQGRRVLDVACGTGHDARRLMAGGLEVVGVDITPAMLSVARTSVAPDASLGLAVADGSRLPFRDRSFDGVLIAAALHHFEEPERVLREMARVVGPGAPVVVGMEPNTWMYGWLIPTWRGIRRVGSRLTGRGAVRSPADEETHGFDEPGLRRLFAEAGLGVESVQRLWYVTGLVHALLETASRLAGLRLPLALPVWCERLLLGLDALLVRLPLIRRFNWNWSVTGRRQTD